jgi:hypothetical protein
MVTESRKSGRRAHLNGGTVKRHERLYRAAHLRLLHLF